MNNIDGHRYFTLRHAENTLFNCMYLWSWPLYKWNCSRWFVFILVKAQIWFPPVPKQTDVGSDLFLVETKLKMFSAEHKPRHRRLAVRPAPPSCTLLTQSGGGVVGNRWARASVWSERMRDEDVSLLWWWLQASGSIWRPADWEALYLKSMRFHSDEQSALSKGLFLNQYSFRQGSPVLCCPHCIGSPTGQMPRVGQANARSAGVSLVSSSLDLR